MTGETKVDTNLVITVCRSGLIVIVCRAFSSIDFIHTFHTFQLHMYIHSQIKQQPLSWGAVRAECRGCGS